MEETKCCITGQIFRDSFRTLLINQRWNHILICLTMTTAPVWPLLGIERMDFFHWSLSEQIYSIQVVCVRVCSVKNYRTAQTKGKLQICEVRDAGLNHTPVVHQPSCVVFALQYCSDTELTKPGDANGASLGMVILETKFFPWWATATANYVSVCTGPEQLFN